MPLHDGSFVDELPAKGAPGLTMRQSLAIAASHLQAGEIRRAERAFLQIARHDSLSGEARFFLGVIAQQRGDLEAATDHYEQAIRLTPDLAEAQNNLGVIFQSRRRFDEAEACFREALRLESDYVEAFNNLGNVLQDQGRFKEAVTAYRRALHFRPRDVDALKHLGNALRALGRLGEAIACYDKGLSLNPGNVLLHTARALVHIEMGDLVQGFAECEWRFHGQPVPIRQSTRPVWDGAPLQGRTIVIFTEQGLGDSIQFIRYATLVARAGGRVVVSCPPNLARILRTCPGVDEVVSDEHSLPEFDCHAPVISLARILGTTLGTIPAEVPYLSAEPACAERWRAELEGVPGFRIGVVWQGNPEHNKDLERSFRLAQLEPVARLPGVRLFSLQKNFGLDQLGTLPDGFSVTDLGRHIDDFSETAAVMKNLDLVISADSSPAHLAGALGVPVWTVLPSVCDWRWMTNREDSPWYPTMRLVRQPRFGDWDGLFDRAARDLAALLQSGATTRSRPGK